VTRSVVTDGRMAGDAAAPQNHYVRAVIFAAMAQAAAHAGNADAVQRCVALTLPAIERAPGWAANYIMVICLVVNALWIIGEKDAGGTIEMNLREKVLAPDFRCVSYDARLSLARLCALDGRFEEARHGFAEARRVLEEQGARPLRAITDMDEAWMEVRRGEAADRDRARTLLASARDSFESLGMPGWLRRADALERELQRSDVPEPAGSGSASPRNSRSSPRPSSRPR